MNARLQLRLIRSGNLLPLSLVNATRRVPQPASNEERARVFRAAMPSPTYNAHDWRTPGQRYAADQAPQDPILRYADRRGF